MSEATACPLNVVADTIMRTIELGVTITGAAIAEEQTWIDCRPVEHDPICPTCGHAGQLRDHVDRVLIDLPVVGHPTRLRMRLPRFLCGNDDCSVVIFRQRTDQVAAAKASTTRRCARWIVQRLAIDKMSVAAIAKALGSSWDTVNTVAADLARELVFGSPDHLDGVRYLGVLSGRSTNFEHYPPHKVAHTLRTVTWCRTQADQIGPGAVAIVAELSQVNAIHRLRAIQGIIALRDRYGAPRLDAACARALEVGDPRYRTVKGILVAGTEAGDTPAVAAAAPPAMLRGPEAFNTERTA